MRIRALSFFLITFLGLCFKVEAAPSFKKDSVVLDAQSREFFESIITPLLKAANISTRGVELYLIVNSDINAFAMPGGMIGMYTGLLEQAENISEIMGVMAHEIGHLKGTHHTQRDQAANRAMMMSMALATLIGGASMAAGSAEGVMAGAAAGMHVGARSFLSYNRSQERSADSIGVKLLKRNKWPTTGLADFFKLLDKMHDPLIDTYESTHPDSRARAKEVAQMSKGYTPISVENYNKEYQVVRAKILAFTLSLGSLGRFIKTLKGDTKDLAQAIASYRHGNSKKALQQLEPLIKKSTKPIYLKELKAEINFDAGNIKESIKIFKEILIGTNSSEIVLAYVQAITQKGYKVDKTEINDAMRRISIIIDKNRSNTFAWFLRGKLYDLLKNKQGSEWCLAEYYSLTNRKKDALRLAIRAEKGADKKIALRAQDLAINLKMQKEKI